MYDQIEVCVNNFKNFVTYEAMLVPLLNGKLPSKI